MPRKKTKRKLTPRVPAKRRGRELIILGSLLLLIFGFWRVYNLRLLAFNRQFQPAQTNGPRPIQINIPKVNIDLSVTETTITDGTWEISPDGASHWDNSANPGENGNIIIYGHNKTNLFGPIRWLSQGDEILLTNSDGQEYSYQITETLTVSPNQTEYLLPKDKETLTLYTCTGWWDSQRYLVIAGPTSI